MPSRKIAAEPNLSAGRASVFPQEPVAYGPLTVCRYLTQVHRQSIPAGQKVPLKYPISVVLAQELPEPSEQDCGKLPPRPFGYLRWGHLQLRYGEQPLELLHMLAGDMNSRKRET